VLLATSATIAWLAATGRLAIWHLAVATFTSGTMWSTDMSVRRLMIGRVVGAARMGHAMVFDAGANNISRMAGPAIGGVVLAAWGIHACFALGAMMYLVAVLAAAGIRYRNPVPAGAQGMLRTVFDAIELARRDRRLLGILLVTLVFNVFAWPNLSLIPVIGKDSLGLDPGGVGLLAAMEGLGAIFGAVTVYFLGRPALYGKLFVYSVLAYLLAFTIFALLPHPLLAALALLAAGIGGSGFAITQSTLAFNTARPEMRGRILGLLSVAIGTGPLGFLQLGLLADTVGAQLAIVIVNCEGLAVLLLTRRIWRQIGMDRT
jgi:MFS family permease